MCNSHIAGCTMSKQMNSNTSCYNFFCCLIQEENSRGSHVYDRLMFHHSVWFKGSSIYQTAKAGPTSRLLQPVLLPPFTRAQSDLMAVSAESTYHLPENTHATRWLSQMMSPGCSRPMFSDERRLLSVRVPGISGTSSQCWLKVKQLLSRGCSVPWCKKHWTHTTLTVSGSICTHILPAST